MNSFFHLCIFFIMANGFCLENAPPHDGRFQRAEYVSSFIKSGDIGAEIGVYQGKFAYHVLLKKNPSKLYLIDPWIYGLQKDIETDLSTKNQIARDVLYEEVCGYFLPYKNVEIIRLKSEEAVDLFENNYFDYVYIDGEHSYDAVMRDLTNYFPKVKIGGYLMGDDYGWTGVMPAVQDFLRLYRGACLLIDDPYQGKTGGQFAIKRLK